MNCFYCKHEPVWERIGESILWGMCRASRAACDRREAIEVDTEYMMPFVNGKHISGCQLWKPKNRT